jgi:hypothetical protein
VKLAPAGIYTEDTETQSTQRKTGGTPPSFSCKC